MRSNGKIAGIIMGSEMVSEERTKDYCIVYTRYDGFAEDSFRCKWEQIEPYLEYFSPCFGGVTKVSDKFKKEYDDYQKFIEENEKDLKEYERLKEKLGIE